MIILLNYIIIILDFQISRVITDDFLKEIHRYVIEL